MAERPAGSEERLHPSGEAAVEADGAISATEGDEHGPFRRGASPLPGSLSSLRAFEAVARRSSFTLAAAELSITQTAVSHQVRKLETRLGVPLFVRERDGVRLSAVGRDYLPSVRAALNMLSAATQRVLDSNDDQSLSVISLANFGLKCLLPRLPEFRRSHPEVSVRLDLAVSLDATASYNHDVAIRYGTGDWPRLAVRRLARERVFPVCSPGFLASAQLLEPRDLVRHTVIATSSLVFRDDWPEWFAEFGIVHADVREWIGCDTMLSAHQAALDGIGVAMGRSPLVDRDLAAGRLVEPFRHRLESATGYYVTHPPELERRRAVASFSEWLQAQFRDPGGHERT